MSCQLSINNRKMRDDVNTKCKITNYTRRNNRYTTISHNLIGVNF